MSFLAGRLAATEGAFFNQHSKQAAIALKQKLKPSTPSSASSNVETVFKPSQADVLAEVLRHSLPIAPTAAVVEVSNVRSAPARSSLAASLKSVLNRVAKDGVADPKAALKSLFVVTRAYSVAKALVFGGSIIAATVTACRHDIKSVDDVRTKVREYCTTQAEQIKYRIEPLKSWVEQKSESWKIEEGRRRAIGADYAKSLGLQQALEDGKSKGR